MEQVILVDKNNQPIGTGEKMAVHQKGQLHRAFSIFIFNSRKRLMLQKRAISKYHCGGLWTNACCSHPRVDENIDTAVHRRLKEEMGFDCQLKEAFTFIYKAKLDHGLTEHEFDHVLIGTFDDQPKINPEEADDWKWIDLEDLKKDIAQNPQNYTPWFIIALPRLEKYLNQSA